MCGIFGAVSTGFLAWGEIENVKTLGILSQLRGTDSTGIVTARTKKNKKVMFESHKDVGDSTTFFNSDDTKKLLAPAHVFCVVGHTRKATCGTVNKINAHPIEEGSIIAVHNGVIDHFRPHKADEDTRTDSRGLIERIARDGIQSAIKEIGNGAYAIVYIDREKKTLNFARNLKRPLYSMWNHGRTTLYWASEKVMLEFLRSREGSGLFKEPTMLPVDKLFTMNLGSLEMKQSDLPAGSVMSWNEYEAQLDARAAAVAVSVLQPLQLPPPPTTEKHQTVHFCRKCQRRIEYCYCEVKNNKSASSVPTVGSNKRYKHWNRQIVPTAKVADILKYGCSFCSTSHSITTPVNWISPFKFVCDGCLRDETTRLYVHACYDKMFRGSLQDGEYGTVLH